MKMRCFYAVIEQPGNISVCHVNEVKDFDDADAVSRWIEFMQTELCPDGDDTQIAIAVSPDAGEKSTFCYGYVGLPHGEPENICNVWNTYTNGTQCVRRSTEWVYDSDVADVNKSWIVNGYELRLPEGRDRAGMCTEHLEMTGDI